MNTGNSSTDADELLLRIHDRHAGMLRGYVIGLPYDAAAADDVVQEVLLRAWQHPEILIRPEPVLRAWLCRVARNLVTDDLRSARHRREIPVDAMPESAGHDDTDALFDRWIIAEALSGLPADHRAVIDGTYHAGRSTAQLADDFGIPVGTVKSRLHYGMRALRAALRDRGMLP